MLKVWEINLELILTTKILKINDLLIANLLMHINIKYSNVPLRSLKSKLRHVTKALLPDSLFETIRYFKQEFYYLTPFITALIDN